MDDTAESVYGFLVEISWKIRNYQESIRLGKLPGLKIIFFDGLEFVSEVFLDNFFHVFSQVFELLLNMSRAGPDTSPD